MYQYPAKKMCLLKTPECTFINFDSTSLHTRYISVIHNHIILETYRDRINLGGKNNQKHSSSRVLPPQIENAWSQKNRCLSKSSIFILSKSSLGASSNSCNIKINVNIKYYNTKLINSKVGYYYLIDLGRLQIIEMTLNHSLLSIDEPKSKHQNSKEDF